MTMRTLNARVSLKPSSLLPALVLAAAAAMPFQVSAGVFINGATDLGTLGGNFSKAFGANNLGQVVGVSATGDSSASLAFLWTSEVGMTDLGTLGGSYSAAVGINNLGQVVGLSRNAAREVRAFLWTAQAGMVDLGAMACMDIYFSAALEVICARAQAINDLGLVAGTSWTAGSTRHAAVWNVEVPVLPAAQESAIESTR